MRAAALALACCTLAAASQAAEPLALEAKIPLGEVRGRIDHLAADLEGRRLFVAELGNDSVGIVDLDAKGVRTIAGLAEPQGVGYMASTGMLYVANARDGSVRVFDGRSLAPAGRIDLGDDADNVRIDDRANRVFVGYGRGAIAVIDPNRRAKIADLPLNAHPEGFQLDAEGARIFANVPDARQIAVLDRAAGRTVATIPTGDLRANFPMALDREGRRVLVVFRNPPKLAAYASGDGAKQAAADVCGDADDVFVDAERHRVYVSCGAGSIDVLEPGASGYARIARVHTVSGARTALFVPEFDRLYLAVRAAGREPAALWVYRPLP